MYENPVQYLLWQDLTTCAFLAIMAMIVMAVFAVPITFMAKNTDDLRALPTRLLGNWLIGVASTTGLWIVLAAFFDALSQWTRYRPFELIIPILIAHLLCTLAGVRFMWLAANTSGHRFPIRFTLRNLLIAQFLILLGCGLWMSLRREDIELMNEMRRILTADQPTRKRRYAIATRARGIQRQRQRVLLNPRPANH